MAKGVVEEREITGDLNVKVCAGNGCVSLCALNRGE